MKRIIVVFLIATTLIGCKKSSDDYYTITGLVLDWDAKTPIAGATVYADRSTFPVVQIDSAITNANGKVTFRYKIGDGARQLSAFKSGYEFPYFKSFFRISFTARTDTIYLARPSYLNVNLHRAGSYTGTDSVQIKVSGNYLSLFPGGQAYYILLFSELKRLANSADTALNTATVYFSAPYNKMFIKWDIIRNGSIISSQTDSTELIQFGAKNYILNY